MKDKWLRTDKAGKIRLIVLALIMAWCAYCVIAYSREIYDLSADTSSMLIDTKTVGPINIDGSDFTAIFIFIIFNISIIQSFWPIITICRIYNNIIQKQ